MIAASALLLASLGYGVLGLMPVDERPRIFEELPNGVKARVQSIDTMERARVVIFIGSDPVSRDEWPAGMGHLLEHLVAKGDGKVDARLENEGASLSAFTGRTGTYFELEGLASDVSFMITEAGKLFGELSVTPDELAKELKIMEQEQAVTPVYRWFDAAGSEAAFGVSGRGAFGDLEALARLDIDQVKAARSAWLVGGNVSVYVEGGVSAGSVIERIRVVFGRIQKGELEEKESPLLMDRGQVKAAWRGRGEARSVVVPGLGNELTFPRVAMGLAIAARSGGKMVYEPSFRGGVVTVWAPEPGSFRWVDQADDVTKFEVLSLAQAYGVNYYRGLFENSTGRSRMEALMLRDAGPVTMETLTSQALALDQAALESAFLEFTKANCIEVVAR